MRLTALEMLGRSAGPQTFQWTDRDYLLYALALGLGIAVGNGRMYTFRKAICLLPR